MEAGRDTSGTAARLLFIAIASVLFGTTMVLSAVGPARASDVLTPDCRDSLPTLRYLA